MAYVDHGPDLHCGRCGSRLACGQRERNQTEEKERRRARAHFTQNPDILARVAALPNPPYCVGFAAESDNVIENARAKLASKGIPLIIANRAQDALGANDNELQLVEGSGVTPLPRDGKLAQARRIVAEIARRVGG